jgi:two-component system, LytTR family, response regulator
MSIRTIIIDDMTIARERIKRLLQKDADIEVIAECRNGQEAVNAIRALSPDLVFLDVQMPKIDGFDVVGKIGAEEMPAVIFVTAYDDFALRAFEINAIDYLLKPFDEERLLRAVERAKREIKARQSGDFNNQLSRLLEEVKKDSKFLKRIAVRSGQQTIILQTEEIDWIGAARVYCELHVGRDVHLIREPLKEFEEKLDPEKFVRVHRSTIVNIDRVKALHPLFNNDHLIILNDGTELNLSRTYYPKLMSLLS